MLSKRIGRATELGFGKLHQFLWAKIQAQQVKIKKALNRSGKPRSLRTSLGEERDADMTEIELLALPQEQKRQLLKWVWTWGTGKNVPIFQDGKIIKQVDLPASFVTFVKERRQRKDVQKT